MGIDDASKILENNSAMADEDDRCKECGCLIFPDGNGEVRCKNQDCKKFNLIVRRMI
jgi:hypothetical protein